MRAEETPYSEEKRMNETIGKIEEILVGDRVFLVDKTLSGEARKISAEVIEIRHILGKQTYVIETEKGNRKVVGASQIRRIESYENHQSV
jgi:hypothetical protein